MPARDQYFTDGRSNRSGAGLFPLSGVRQLILGNQPLAALREQGAGFSWGPAGKRAYRWMMKRAGLLVLALMAVTAPMSSQTGSSLRGPLPPGLSLRGPLPPGLPLRGPLPPGLQTSSVDTSVTRATLDNGLRVVIVRDPLAPVVTVEENYLVGGDETPAGFPGMAHAQEHMAFRGCKGLSADQIAAIYAQLGGAANADTQQNITQYFVTVPSQDLEIALRLDAACMRDVEDSQVQ